jgi:hypothetical protein
MNGIRVAQSIADRAYDRETDHAKAFNAYRDMIRHLLFATVKGEEIYSPDNCRVSRAVEIVEGGHVALINGAAFAVGGNGTDYAVTLDNGKAHCECVDFQNHKLPCKHIIAASIVQERIETWIRETYVGPIKERYYAGLANKLYRRGHLMSNSERSKMVAELAEEYPDVASLFRWR